MSQIHDLSDFNQRKEADSDSYYYVGITGRDWLLRLNEHIREALRGDRIKFHQAWIESMGMTDVLFTSYLSNINQSYKDAMDWEEENVDKIAYGPNGLNMIPGGFKGHKFLHEHRITDRENISLDEREHAIAEYVRQNPRKGIPNPFIAQLWKDDEFYLKVINAREKTLTPAQVTKIRELDKMGHSVTEITKEVDALNET